MQVDSLISSIMFSAFLSMAIVMAVVIGVLVVVFRMIARNRNAAGAASRMTQPVSGTLLVTGISMPTENAIYHSARLTGVVSAGVSVGVVMGGFLGALAHEAVRFEVGDGFGDLVMRPVDQGPLREEHVVVDAELAEIFLDHGEHGGECRVAHDRQPFALRQAKQLASVLLDEQDADRLQIVAWIEAFRNLADVFPERLPVAEVG